MLMLSMLLTACGDTDVVAVITKTGGDSSLIGKYIPIIGEMSGVALVGDDLDGFSIELSKGGKGTITAEGETSKLKWKEDGSTLIIRADGEEMTAQIEDGCLIFDDLFGMGMKFTFAKEGSDAADPSLYLPEAEKYLLGDWQSTEVTDILGDPVDPSVLKSDDLFITFRGDHTADVTVEGKEYKDVRWNNLDNYGALESDDLNISWEPDESRDGLRIDYVKDGDYYTFFCPKGGTSGKKGDSGASKDDDQSKKAAAGNEELYSVIGTFEGDWVGQLVYEKGTGSWEDFEDISGNVVARFVFDENGGVTPYFAANVKEEYDQFRDMKAEIDLEHECLMVTGNYLDNPMELTAAVVENGLLCMFYTIYGSGDDSVDVAIGMRKFGDAWSDDDYPRMSDSNAKAMEEDGFTLEEVVSYFDSYPKPIPDPSHIAELMGVSGSKLPSTEKLENADSGKKQTGSSKFCDYWDKDWYGWYELESCKGDYENLEGARWDCCGAIFVNDDDSGSIFLFDEEGSVDDLFCACEVSFLDGVSSVGCMQSEEGYFWSSEPNIHHADWSVEPEISPFKDFDNLIYITGIYEDDDGKFRYDIYLKPWGADWEDVRDYDDQFLPTSYDSWYVDVMNDYMPDKIG